MENKTHEITAASIFIPLDEGASLHLRRICPSHARGQAVFMLHGSIENGRIFYSDSGKGFGPYLARAGYDVFIGDLRGRGKSSPAINGTEDHGQHEAITQEIPAFLDKIREIRGEQSLHLVAHSWGGVNLLAYLARPHRPVKVDSMVFATKRSISVRNMAWLWMIWFGWGKLGKRSIRRKGFLDAKGFNMGSDNITAKTWRETQEWIISKEWKHWYDGFDYGQAFGETQLPPTLYFAGKKDRVLGHPKDIRNLIHELGPSQNTKFHMLSKRKGHLHDYGHNDMLIHKDAVRDHFPMALEWMQKNAQ